MTEVNNHWSLIFLNINGLNSFNKMTKTNRMDTETGSILPIYTRNKLQHQGYIVPQTKGLKKNIFQTNEPKKQVWTSILIANKIDFKTKLIQRNKEGHYILIKRKIHQYIISIPEIDDQNTRAPMFVKDTCLQLKSHADPHILIVGGINTSFSPFDRSSKQMILNREILELIDAINQQT